MKIMGALFVALLADLSASAQQPTFKSDTAIVSIFATVTDRDNRLATCRKKALEQLEKAVKYGWRDKAWLNKDPDLKSVRGMPEFKKIFGTAPKSRPKATLKKKLKPANKLKVRKPARPKAVLPKKALPKAVRKPVKKKEG